MSNRFSNDKDFDSKLTSQIHDLMKKRIIQEIRDLQPRMYLFGGMIHDLIVGTKPNGYDVMVVAEQVIIQNVINMLKQNYEYTEEYSKRLGGNHIVRFPELTIILVNQNEKLVIDFPVNSLAVKLEYCNCKFTISDICTLLKYEKYHPETRIKVSEIFAQIRHKELIHDSVNWKDGEEVFELYRICKMFSKGYTSKQAKFVGHLMYLCRRYEDVRECSPIIDSETFEQCRFINANLRIMVDHYAAKIIDLIA